MDTRHHPDTLQSYLRTTKLGAHPRSAIFWPAEHGLSQIRAMTLLPTDASAAITYLKNDWSVIHGRVADDWTALVPPSNRNDQICGLRIHRQIESAPLCDCFLHVILGGAIGYRASQKFASVGMNHD